MRVEKFINKREHVSRRALSTNFQNKIKKLTSLFINRPLAHATETAGNPLIYDVRITIYELPFAPRSIGDFILVSIRGKALSRVWKDYSALLQAYTHSVVLHAIAEDYQLSVLNGLDDGCLYGCVIDSRRSCRYEYHYFI